MGFFFSKTTGLSEPLSDSRAEVILRTGDLLLVPEEETLVSLNAFVYAHVGLVMYALDRLYVFTGKSIEPFRNYFARHPNAIVRYLETARSTDFDARVREFAVRTLRRDKVDAVAVGLVLKSVGLLDISSARCRDLKPDDFAPSTELKLPSYSSPFHII